MSSNPSVNQTLRKSEVTDPSDRFFLGVRTAPRPHWQQFFSEPSAPSRYGEAAAAKFINEKRQKQEEMAGRTPISAHITDAVVLDGNGNSVLRASNGDVPTASVHLIEFISSSRRTAVSYLPALPIAADVQVRWFGFDIRDVMSMACLECMRYNASAPSDEAKVQIPSGIWYYRHFSPAPFIDPYETLVPSSMRDHVDLFSLCEFLGISVPSAIGEDPAAKAELARQLALRGQFWPVESNLM